MRLMIRVGCVVLVAVVSAVTWLMTGSGSVPGASAASSSGPTTIAWFAGMYPGDQMTAQLDKFQQYHIGGFNFDYVYNGTHDDFLNGGAGRLPTATYNAFVSWTQNLVSMAASKGVTENYIRLLADVLIRSNPPATQNKFDIYNQTEINSMQQTFTNEATFAKAVGLKGIWIDAEPYDYNWLWGEEQDPTMAAYGKTPDQLANQYFLLGQTAERAMLSVYPNIQVIMSPAFGYEGSGPGSYYEWYAWFYAGMVSVAAQQNANGFVLATEAGFGISATYSFPGIYNYEEGTDKIAVHNGVPIYSNLVWALLWYDQAHGTQLYQWHVAHSTVALPTWPYNPNGQLRFPLTSLQQVLLAERAKSPKYTWVYDQNGQWLGSSYTCTWNGQTTTGPLACPGLVLRDTLPPLST